MSQSIDEGNFMRKKNTLVALLAASSFFGTLPAYSLPTFVVESAPVFADPGGSNKVVGTFGPAYSESFTFGTPTNTGPLADYDSTPPLNFGFDFWIKSEAGSSGPSNQMVIQLEGADNGANGGMFDVSNNIIKHDNDQAIPAGKVLWNDQVRVRVNDIAFPSAPTVLTNSRIQNYVTFGGHNPATDTLDPNSALWQNILDDATGLTPIIQTSFDASGLDILFEFEGGGWVFDALEDQALRIVTFFNGDLPGNGGPDPDPNPMPLPGTLALLALGVVSLIVRRRSNNGV